MTPSNDRHWTMFRVLCALFNDSTVTSSASVPLSSRISQYHFVGGAAGFLGRADAPVHDAVSDFGCGKIVTCSSRRPTSRRRFVVIVRGLLF